MMTDYSQWLQSLPSPVPPIFCLVLGFAAGIAGAVIAAICNDPSPDESKPGMNTVKTSIIITVLTILGFGLIGYGVIALREYATYPRTFTVETEERFSIKHLRCDGRECPKHELPMDGTHASWLKNGRYETGTIIVGGNKIGLAESNGELLS